MEVAKYEISLSNINETDIIVQGQLGFYSHCVYFVIKSYSYWKKLTESKKSKKRIHFLKMTL